MDFGDIIAKAMSFGIYGFAFAEPGVENEKYIGHYSPRIMKFHQDYILVAWGIPGPDLTEYYYKDYGKTWALTKEELLSENKSENLF